MSENSNPLGPAPVQVEDQPLPISMSLLQFDKIVVLSECGEIYEAAYDPSFNQWDATAQCNVSLNDIKNMFAFQSDHFDVDDVSANDIRFYVDNNAIPELDLSSNLVFSGPVITTSPTGGTLDMRLQKDYVRHLAKLLFNTAYGTDLFINEEDLVASVLAALQSAWSSCAADLLSISIIGDHAALTHNLDSANEPHHYLLHDAVDENSNDKFNICREIFKMMVSRASSRFVDLEPLEIVDVVDGDAAKTRIDPNANNLYRLPFVPGDQLVMRVVIKPCEDQPSFLDVAKDAVIQANQRAYLFYLNLV
jgi:hypothetical protein